MGWSGRLFAHKNVEKNCIVVVNGAIYLMELVEGSKIIPDDEIVLYGRVTYSEAPKNRKTRIYAHHILRKDDVVQTRISTTPGFNEKIMTSSCAAKGRLAFLAIGLLFGVK